MTEIESALHQLHNAHPTQPNGSATRTQRTSFESKAFAKVDKMLSESPAAEAGLEVGDLLIQVGDIKRSLDAMQRLPVVVREGEGREVELVVLKEGREEPTTLTLRPQRGSGHQGLLGCHIVPFHG